MPNAQLLSPKLTRERASWPQGEMEMPVSSALLGMPAWGAPVPQGAGGMLAG
jgi:hypothetical protein